MCADRNKRELDEVVRVGKLRTALRDEMHEVAREEIAKDKGTAKKTGYKVPDWHRTKCRDCGKVKMSVGPNGEGIWSYGLTKDSGRLCECPTKKKRK